MAKELGADFPQEVKREDTAEQLAKKVEELLGAQPHVTIECTGVQSSVQTAIYVSGCHLLMLKTSPFTKAQGSSVLLIGSHFPRHLLEFSVIRVQVREFRPWAL